MNLPAWFLVATACCPPAGFAQEPAARFGTTVAINSGLRGQIYHLHRDTQWLPDFRKMKPAGTIYTSSLNIPSQNLMEGFPGVTKRFEWFAIVYTGRLWIASPGEYKFVRTSDDGCKLWIDGRLVVDNDGIYAARTPGRDAWCAGCGANRARHDSGYRATGG